MTGKAAHKLVISKPGGYTSHGNEATKIAKAKNNEEARREIREQLIHEEQSKP